MIQNLQETELFVNYLPRFLFIRVTTGPNLERLNVSNI